MKRLFVFLLLFGLVLAPIACKVPAKRVVVATITTVHQAMLAWRDYVASGKASPEDEARIRDAYGRYQQAVRVAKKVFAEADANPDNQVDVNSIAKVVAAASQGVITNVTQLIAR